MKTTTITSFASFLEQACSKSFDGFLFRGAPDLEGNGLLPTIGQIPGLQGGTLDRLTGFEKKQIERFKLNGARLVEGNPNQWDWMVIGLQHGLPVRILEWSGNPLIGLFFAVHENPKTKSAVYAERFTNEFNTMKHSDPFAIKKTGIFQSSFCAPRISSQASSFSIHPDPRKTYTSPSLHCFEISPKLAPNLRSQLRRCGIDPATVFPDLNGLAKSIRQ